MLSEKVGEDWVFFSGGGGGGAECLFYIPVNNCLPSVFFIA